MISSAKRIELDGVTAGLDPADWPAYRAVAHQMLDEAMSLIEGVRERPVWQPVPNAAKQALTEPLPLEPQGVAQVAADATRLILPFATGNIHPRFFGWVHGSGTPGGVIAEMLAAAMNSNAGGRDHGAIHVERQVIEWCRGLFGFPDAASGLLVSGTSVATLIALTVARNATIGPDARKLGLAAAAQPLVAYTSSEAHSSVARAMELLGLGSAALRSIPADTAFRLTPELLRQSIHADKAKGNKPLAVIATAGTVNTGAIDPLAEIADICAAEGIWLHVDGAFGALAMLSDTLRPRLAGIERANSLAFDFHKWLHVPYDAGCVLVRDGALHRDTFSNRPAYLKGHARGLAAGEPWLCDFGPELSRGFRALKVWFTLKEHGTLKLAASIEDNCRLAGRLGELVASEPRLELLAPVSLNIACFRVRSDALTPEHLDRLNEDIVAELQERGIAAPSTTRIGGKLAIRVNITNHRTRDADIDLLLASVLAIGSELLALEAAKPPSPEAPGKLPFECLLAVEVALARPEIAAILGDISVSIDNAGAAPFVVTGHGSLRLRPRGLANPLAAAVLIRHGVELANWGQSGEADDQAAHALLAARCAGLYLKSLAEMERTDAEQALPAWLLLAYQHLSAPLDAASLAGLAARPNDLIERLMSLSAATADDVRAVAASTGLRVAAINRFAQHMALAAPAEHLLTHGGDARITADPRTGRNGYGSSARPVTGEISFSSSTASCISPSAYASVEALRQRLQAGGDFSNELERVRAGVLKHSGAARVSGTETVLTASGTDAELATLALSLAYDARPLTSMVVSPEETGSGVPQATMGCHFSIETALGQTVKPGACIEGLANGRVQSVSVAIRNAEGQARPLADVSADVLAAAEEAVANGRRVLLHVLDAAKTGIGAPALADVVVLTQRFGDAIDIAVDACQARLGPEAVAGYLARGWLVQMTGSKFWGGPPFSGALLVPKAFLTRTERLAPVLGTLKSYMARGEWPAAFGAARDTLPDVHNLGLLTRWQAAINEAENYAGFPPQASIQRTRQFMAAVAQALSGHPELLPLDGTPIDHAPICDGDSWRDLRSIVPFVATRAGTPLTLAEAKLLHQSLARDASQRLAHLDLSDADRQLAAQPCHLGQPVKLGSTAALRICASSRTIVAMAQAGGIETLARDLATVLAKTRLLLRHFEAL